MKEEFNDIFEKIGVLHKKYSTSSYLENIERFNKDSKDLINILEKYKVKNVQNSNNKIKKHQKV